MVRTAIWTVSRYSRNRIVKANNIDPSKVHHEAVAQACIEILKGGDKRTDGEWLREQTLTHFSKKAMGDRFKQLL